MPTCGTSTDTSTSTDASTNASTCTRTFPNRCSIVEGHEKEGVMYCCATGEQCECGCCETLEEEAED